MENSNTSIFGHGSESESLMNILGAIKKPQGLLKYIKKTIAFSIFLSDEKNMADLRQPVPSITINKSYSSWLSESRRNMRKINEAATREEYMKEIKEDQAAKNKELEEKFPDLAAIFDEALKFDNEVAGPYGESAEVKRLEQMMETSEEEGPAAFLKLIGGFVKEIGLRKSLKMVRDVVKMANKGIGFEKKIKEILPKGEKYECPGLGIVTGGEPSASEEIINNIKETITIKNLMKIISGKENEVEIGYQTKDGKEAEGEIKGVEVKDGSIEVTIENDKVGDVKKDITEIIEDDGKEDSGGPEEMKNKLALLKAKDPDSINKVMSFANFVSNDENKDKISQIDKILGV